MYLNLLNFWHAMEMCQPSWCKEAIQVRDEPMPWNASKSNPSEKADKVYYDVYIGKGVIGNLI